MDAGGELFAELQKHEILPQIQHDILEEKTRAILRDGAIVTESEDI